MEDTLVESTSYRKDECSGSGFAWFIESMGGDNWEREWS